MDLEKLQMERDKVNKRIGFAFFNINTTAYV